MGNHSWVRIPPLPPAASRRAPWPQHPPNSPSQASRTMKTLLLYIATALAEIIGCYLPWLWLKQGRSAWLLVPAALSLALFVWLLTLHPHAAGRVYAAYGGVYISVALMWLWVVDAVRPTVTDLVGVGVCLLGMAIIMLGARPA